MFDSRETLQDRLRVLFATHLDHVRSSNGGWKLNNEEEQRAWATALTIVCLWQQLFPGNGHAIDLDTGNKVQLKKNVRKEQHLDYPLTVFVEGARKCVGQGRWTSFTVSWRVIDLAPETTHEEFILKVLETFPDE